MGKTLQASQRNHPLTHHTTSEISHPVLPKQNKSLAKIGQWVSSGTLQSSSWETLLNNPHIAHLGEEEVMEQNYKAHEFYRGGRWAGSGGSVLQHKPEKHLVN